MPRYLDPKNDLVFKKIFGEHPNLLIDFLNALLPLPEDGLVESVEYLSPEQVPPTPLSYRRSIVDVKCRDQQGRTFIVEMQMFWTIAFQQRMLFSASQAYVQQIRPGRDYRLLQPVYALGLINEVFDKESPDWYHHYKIVNIDKPTREIKGLQFVFVEIPKFKPETALDKKIRRLWLRFLKEIDQGEFDPPPELLAYPPTAEALEISREAGFTEAELLAYQEYWDGVSVEITLLGERTALAEAEGLAKGLARGQAIGEAIGEAKGEAKGEAIGLAKGREEGALAEKQAIARNLLEVLDDAIIAAKTGLAVEEVARLRGEA
jgi:predicted transposase/invertase (TIGR01784 family)